MFELLLLWMSKAPLLVCITLRPGFHPVCYLAALCFSLFGMSSSHCVFFCFLSAVSSICTDPSMTEDMLLPPLSARAAYVPASPSFATFTPRTPHTLAPTAFSALAEKAIVNRSPLSSPSYPLVSQSSLPSSSSPASASAAPSSSSADSWFSSFFLRHPYTLSVPFLLQLAATVGAIFNLLHPLVAWLFLPDVFTTTGNLRHCLVSMQVI